MRFSRPSTGTILGAIALFVALGGTAFAAGATVVNIADPTTPSRIAHVTSGGLLETEGSDSVTNTVNTELAAPSAYVHDEAFIVKSSAGCVKIAAPASGKAMIVREVRIDVTDNPSPGPGEGFAIYDDANCSGNQVADLVPPTVGETTLPFDPGLGVPANSGLSANAVGSVVADVFSDGYSVASSQVPATGLTATGSEAPQHQP